MNYEFTHCFEYKIIYVFTINDDLHKGLLKIGDATLKTDTDISKLAPNTKELNQAALERIKSYTSTIGVTPKLLHTELAVKSIVDTSKKIPVLKAFRDHDVHAVLKNSNIQNKTLGNSKEWFEIDLNTALAAIQAVKNNYGNLSHTTSDNFVPIVFRPEQEEAIRKTVKQFKKNNRMLWNAKMRFGKTISALEVIRQCRFDKTIIITHRPVVNAGWYEDFEKIFHYENDYIYGSKSHGYTVDQLLELDPQKSFVYFASIQDLRGSSKVGGKFDKNDVIFDTEWDCVIVDEAHEGTQTVLGDDVIKKLVKEGSDHDTKFLALSGTPFNIIEHYDEDAIYTWDYIQEQEYKNNWNLEHFGDSNPYEELPELKIYTYNLGDILSQNRYVSFEDKAFNFHEFFRTWTGDFKHDYANMPANAQVGDFVHEADVWSFLNLMTKSDEKSCYPFSNEEYRELFKHTFWMLPGVREAKALSALMHKHPVFGSGAFNIINVAGDGDIEDKNEEALTKVRNAINSCSEGEYTITLSCGKLTTGVTVREWTGVFMLAGSFSTSASQYLQTIFRVQSPANIDGKIKETAYVFDFAPDRTLKMVSAAVAVSGKAGKTSSSDRILLGKFLNYCPVIGISGSKMHEYDTNRLLQQLKKAYAEKAVQNGFDDTSIYNDELLKLNAIDLAKFTALQGIIGKTKAQEKTDHIDINKQGLTDEEYEELEDLEDKKKKKKDELTEEQKKRLEELKEAKKTRNNAISILRGISIRMPMLIYGADVEFNQDISINQLTTLVDNSSWKEFMPKGVTKPIFKDFIKYYDQEVFIAAGNKIRGIAKEADLLTPTKRVQKIASLFSYFKNPDKETVLTPWRVVNMHMSNTIGGYDFWNAGHEYVIDSPRYVEQDNVTSNIFDKADPQILEINSKTGLYPLYVTYSVYRRKLDKLGIVEDDQDINYLNELWKEAIQNNVFVVCKTPMAKLITQRTLMGYSNDKINAHYFDDLINVMQNKPYQFIDKVKKPSYWKKEGKEMKFDAIVGNPPYQLNIGKKKENYALAIYDKFVDCSIAINPNYISMITPSRWFTGGRGLDEFRSKMLNDDRFCRITDFSDSKDCFPGVDVSGGVNYFLWDRNHSGNCEFTSIHNGISTTMDRKLNEFDVFPRENEAISIIHKVLASSDENIVNLISPQTPFGFITTFVGKSDEFENSLKLYGSKGVSYVSLAEVKKNIDLVYKYKIMFSKATCEHAGTPDKNGQYRVISSHSIIGPKELCTQSYLIAGGFETLEEANSFMSYFKTKFFRFLLHQGLTSQDISREKFIFIPQQDYHVIWDDQQLYKKYNLTSQEINFIEQTIREM